MSRQQYGGNCRSLHTQPSAENMCKLTGGDLGFFASGPSPFSVFSKFRQNRVNHLESQPQIGPTVISSENAESDLYQRILKTANPSVAMLVCNNEGKQRAMRIEERRLLYLQEWFTVLKKRVQRLKIRDNEIDNYRCCHICNEETSETTLLVSPHLHYNSNCGKKVDSPTNCVLCIKCLLLHSFNCRGMNQFPRCPFCNITFEEKTLIPFTTHFGD